jgi:hypothetical protein
MFPVLHRPTFVFRACSPSLLLNAMALGSLFVGTDEAVSKVCNIIVSRVVWIAL